MVPDVVASCNQPWLATSTEAAHETGCGQFPVTLSVSVCAGGFGCSRVATNARCVGATCSAHGGGTGVGVPGALVLDGAGDGVVTGVPGTGVPLGGVPETGVVFPVVFAGIVADGERTVS